MQVGAGQVGGHHTGCTSWIARCRAVVEGLHGLRRTIALQRRNTRRWHAAGRKELKTLVVIMRIRHDDVPLASIGRRQHADVHLAPSIRRHHANAQHVSARRHLDANCGVFTSIGMRRGRGRHVVFFVALHAWRHVVVHRIGLAERRARRCATARVYGRRAGCKSKCMHAVINIHGAPDIIVVLVVNERLPNTLASVDKPRGDLREAQPCLIMSACKKVYSSRCGSPETRSTHSGSTELP
jgi:hypothetical protein